VRTAVAALQDALGLATGLSPDEAPAARVPVAQHAALIDDAIAFIEGAADDVMLAVARRRDEAAIRNKLEVAGREGERLERLRRLRARHAALEAATGLNVLVMAPASSPAEEACFLFCGGRLVAQRRLPRRLPYRDQARVDLAALIAEHYRPEDASRSFARQEEIDQLFILAQWHRDRREGLSYVELPPRTPQRDEAGLWATAVLDGSDISQ
jgi:excinuclease UvrABC nuclease subunit